MTLEQGTYLGVGDTGRLVWDVNVALHHKGLLEKDADDVFDESTKQAVKQFQELSRTDADGVIGQTTWTYLFADQFDVNQVPFVPWFNTFQKQHESLFPHILQQEAFEFVFSRLGKLTGRGQLSKNEFVGHFCIIYNETGGTFLPLSEQGRPNHPNPFESDAYFFTTYGGRKRSYNQSPNVPAGTQLAEWNIISSQADIDAWNDTETYPENQPDEVKLAARNCDFYKFRGRGLNQITWRNAYEKFVQPIMDLSLSLMTNKALDAAFQKPDIYAAVFMNFAMDKDWTGKSIPDLVRGNFGEYPKYVAGRNKTSYHRLFVERCETLKAAIEKAEEDGWFAPMEGPVS